MSLCRKNNDDYDLTFAPHCDEAAATLSELADLIYKFDAEVTMALRSAD